MASTTHVHSGPDTTGTEIVPWSEKVWRKSKEEPLVPIGVLATTGALTMAILSFRKRQSWNMQYWMRARVAAQAFTVGAMCVYYYSRSPGEVEKTRHLDEASAKREQRENKDRQEFLTRLKGAENQWKADQGDSLEHKGVEQPTIPETDGSKVVADVSATSGASWWKMSWLWGGSAKQSQAAKDNK